MRWNEIATATAPWRRLSRRSWEAIGICALLVVLVMAVFGQTVGYDFINYDDPLCVYRKSGRLKGADAWKASAGRSPIARSAIGSR